MSTSFSPHIIVYCCNWCSYAGADTAGVMRISLPPNFRVIRVMCSGRVSIPLVLWPLITGADGVLVTGCHPGDCHYISGNLETRTRIDFLHKVLHHFGLQERIRMEYVAASEPQRFGQVVQDFTSSIQSAGPLNLSLGTSLELLSSDGRVGRQELIKLLSRMRDALNLSFDETPVVDGDGITPGFGQPIYDPELCNGCGACARSCPMDNIKISDDDHRRTIGYFHSSCVACGTCEESCPVEAIKVVHNLQLDTFLSWERLQGTELLLAECRHCGAPFVPERQRVKLMSDLKDAGKSTISLEVCEKCRRAGSAREILAAYAPGGRRGGAMR